MTAQELIDRLHDSEPDRPVIWEDNGYTYALVGVEAKASEYGVRVLVLKWELDGIGG